MRWTLGMVAALVLASVREASAQPALPDPPKLIRFAAELQVDLGPGTERCPDPAYLRREVVAELGYDPFAAGTKWRRAGAFDVKIARIPSGLEATTTFVDDASVTQWTRSYRDHTTTRAACESVYKGVALEIEAELTRFDDARRATACPAPTPCPSCPAPMPCLDSRFSIWPTEWPMPPLRPPAPDPPKPLERWPVAVRLGVAAWPELIASGWGSFGVSAEIGVRYRAVSLGVEAHGDPPIGSVAIPGGAVTFGRVSGALLLCAHYGWFAGCGVGDVGRFIFPAHAPALPASTHYGSAGARARMEFPVVPPWLFIQTTFDMRAPIDPASYTADHVNVFKAAGLSFGFGIGVLVELPTAAAGAAAGPAGAPVASR